MAIRKLSVLTLFTLSAAMVHAATQTWTGAVDNLWTHGGNWVSGMNPNLGDSLVFLSSAVSFTSTNNEGTFSTPSITLDSTTAYLINGESNANFIVMQAPAPSISFNPTVMLGKAHNISARIQLAANLSITQTTTTGSQISGDISDNSMGFSVTYTGGGFGLTGPNSYTGGTIINPSSILFGTTQTIPTTGGVNIGMASFLIFNQNFSDTYAGLLTGAGNFLITSPGLTTQSITLTNVGNNYAGITDIDVGSTLIGTTSTIPSNLGCQFFNSGAFLNFNQAFAGAYTSPITGPGSVIISGGGVVTLSNAGNTYSAGTTITTGTLSVGTDANMGALTAPVNLGSASTDFPVLQANAAFTTGRPITVNAAISVIDPNGFILTHNATNGGAATGSGGLRIGAVSGGTLQLQAPYSYTGGTILVSGNLVLSGPTASLPSPGPAPQGDLTLQGITTVFDMSSATLPSTTVTIGNLLGISGAQVLLGSNTLVVTSSAFNSFASTISGAGQVIKTGPATWDVQGVSNYTGGTQVNQGILEVTAGGVLPTTGPVTIASGATLDIGGAAAAQTIGNLSGAGTLDLGGNNLFHNPTSTTTFSGQITSGGSSVFTQNTAQTLILSGSSTDLLGSVTIAQGAIQAGIANIFPNINLLTIAGGATFNLQGFSQTIGGLTGSGNATFQSGETLTVGANASSTTFGGVISGPGTLTKAGAGTFDLTNAQTYTGGTQITGGTLQLQGAGAQLPINGSLNVGSGATFDMSGAGVPAQTIGNLSGGGSILLGSNTLNHVPTANSTFSGTLNGGPASIFNQNAPFILTLSGSSTSFTGEMEISQGTVKGGTTNIFPNLGLLAISGGATFDLGGFDQTIGNLSGAGNIHLGNHTLTLVPTGPNTFSGAITGGTSSILNQNAPFTLTLSGSSPGMTGELRVSQGTVQPGIADIMPNLRLLHISSGGTFNLNGFDQSIGDLDGSGTLNLTNNKLSNHSISDRTFSGVIQGTNLSKFVHHGNHTLTLTGVSTTTGDFEIANGTVKVDAGAVVPAHFTVDAAGRLRGKGTVASVQNFGRVEPGASIGTLFINPGPYNESGTLQIEVNDLGQASSVDVTGNINISGGTTLKLVPDLGSYTDGTVFTVATFSGIRTGTYSNVVTALANRFAVTAIYNPQDIQVRLGVIPFLVIITGGNAGAAAHCIESIPHGHGTDGLVVINALETLSDDLSALRKAFNQLQPSQFAALALAQENNDILVRSALTQRSFYRCAKKKVVKEEPTVATTDTNGTEQQTTPPPAEVEETPIRKGTIWIEPLGKYAHQNRQQHNFGYHAATGGILAGADYQILSSTLLGGALGYTFTDLDWKSSAGKADINSYYGTLYGSWSCDRYFVDATFIGAYNHYHAQRNIHFPGIHRHANNEHSGYQLAESLGTGVFFNPGEWQIQPFARADYIFLHQRGFKEHGAKSLDLKIEKTNSRYIRTDLGVKADWCYKTAKLKYIPYLKASWVWEKQLDGAHFESSFKDTSCVFKVTGLRPVRSLFAPSTGITILAHEETFSFEFHYDLEVGKNFWENRGYINFSHRY